MTSTSPPPDSSSVAPSHSSSSSAAPAASRPPARNKSSSSLSTHTLRSLSSTSTGKPRRNKSAVSLHHSHSHGHGHAGGHHHHIQFTSHHKKSGSGGAASQGMKRRGSSQSSSNGNSSTGGGGGNNPFGLGMTSMTTSDSHEAGNNTGEGDGQVERKEKEKRPDLGVRRTSSSSSTATIGRSKSRGSVRRQNSIDTREREREGGGGGTRSRAGSRSTRDENKVAPASASVTSTASTNEWTSETDSPLHIGKKLPEVEDFKPEGTSRLSRALEGEQQGSSRNVTPSRTRKSKFQFAEDEDEEDDEEPEEESTAPEIPSAAMPPAETPVLPTLPAMLQAITPARSPDPDEVRAPEEPTPEQFQQIAALQAPAPPSAPQGISPPDHGEFGQLPLTAGPELSRSPSPMTRSEESKSRSGGVDEPSLAQATANVDEPNMAVKVDKEHQQKHQGLKSVPRPTGSRHESPASSNKVTPEGGRSPAGPNPTQLQEEEKEQLQANSQSQSQATSPPSTSSSQLPRPVRTHPTRKSSNASVMSMASARSNAPSLISRMHQPPPHFRRSASGIAPTINREAIVRGEMSTPSPEPVNEEGARDHRGKSSRRSAGGGGARSTAFGHERTSSQTSNRSVRLTDSPTKRSNTYAAGEIQRSRTVEPLTSTSSASGGGALAALGQIHQAATARTPSIMSPGIAPSEGSRTPGALTHAKRSASGYFSSALRGLTSLPSALTPPLSPSAGTSTFSMMDGRGATTPGGGGSKHPIPGSSGFSQTGGGGNGSYPRTGGTARTRTSPSPQQPPLIVKFLEQPSLPPPSSRQDPSTSPHHQSRPPSSLSQANRNASSASLAMSRTQQKALLARDAPYPSSTSSSTNMTPSTSHHHHHQPSNGVGLAPPPSPIPSSQSHPYLPSNPPHSSPVPAGASASSSNGMQRWAFGLIKEAERIERQWRCIEKWRDPVGESLERVLHKGGSGSGSGMSRLMERGGSGGTGSNSGSESAGGPGKLVRIQKGRSLTAH
ncbi:uncharacterized protein JCM6883_006521 [Sporobolomyces salmoneus]|uniref:uncharacterized protein n=1 Tax=Sporobolomyces salmoneus TaxID=183962 RepID=UPI003177AAD1